MEFLYPTLVPLVGALMALIIMATYIGGKVFRIPEWEAYFNVEMHSLIFAVLIIGAAFACFESVDAISRSLLGADPIEASQTFLNTILNKGVLPMYKDLLVIEAGTSLSSSFMLLIGPVPWSYKYKVEPGADAILSMVRMMSFGLLVVYTSLTVQYMGLSFINFGAPIALSLGMLLFILPPTRDSGIFLIALAFAFQTIFPFTYALNQVILNDMACAQHGLNPPCDYKYEAYVPQMGVFGVQIRGVSFFSYLVPFATYANFLLLIPFINAIAHLALISLFLPALSIALTIAFMNAVAKFLMGKTS